MITNELSNETNANETVQSHKIVIMREPDVINFNINYQINNNSERSEERDVVEEPIVMKSMKHDKIFKRVKLKLIKDWLLFN